MKTLDVLLQNGANINEPDAHGTTPVLSFAKAQHWDAAVFVVERGANLDTWDGNGMSLDHLLAEWQRGDHGAPTEGFKKLGDAVTARRGHPLSLKRGLALLRSSAACASFCRGYLSFKDRIASVIT